VIDEIGAEIFVKMDENFGVAARCEGVPARNQLLAESFKVVNLAVEDGPDGSVLIADGLPAILEIDDAEASHAETDVSGNKSAVIVRTAMDHRIAHALDVLSGDRMAVETQNSRYAAHDCQWLFRQLARRSNIAAE